HPNKPKTAYTFRSDALAPRDKLLAVDHDAHAERALLALGEKPDAAAAHRVALAPALRLLDGNPADRIFKAIDLAVRFDEQHRQAVGFRPRAPVCSNIVEIACNQQRH